MAYLNCVSFCFRIVNGDEKDAQPRFFNNKTNFLLLQSIQPTWTVCLLIRLCASFCFLFLKKRSL